MKTTDDIIDELRLAATSDPAPAGLSGLLTEAADRLDNLFASGIHTCHADCQRPMCVLRRERDKAHADLARVTAERDNARAQAIADRAFQSDNAALRARVAELDESLHLANGTADLALHHRDIAEQRNAELVAALRPIYALRKNCEGDIGWRGQKDAKVGWVTVRDILALEQALARAESATPAKHPDTVRLDWLASNKQSGGKAFCLQWTFRDNNNQTNIRDAIDAARKQPPTT